MAKEDYYYQHVNGSVIFKPWRVVEMGGGPHSYFHGPFMKRWWKASDWPEDLPKPESLNANAKKATEE